MQSTCIEMNENIMGSQNEKGNNIVSEVTPLLFLSNVRHFRMCKRCGEISLRVNHSQYSEPFVFDSLTPKKTLRDEAITRELPMLTYKRNKVCKG